MMLQIFSAALVQVNFMQMISSSIQSWITHLITVIYRVILNELQQWSDRWQLNISYKKCDVLFLSNQKKRPQIDLVLGDSMIPQV